MPVLFVSDGQINFVVPGGQPEGQMTLLVQNLIGTSAAVRVPVIAVQPGIFFDSVTGMGAITVAGTGQTTTDRPAAPGEYLEIYATGLGEVRRSNGLSETTWAVEVKIGNVLVRAAFSGLAPKFIGLYQVNVQVPAGVSGLSLVQLLENGKASNEVKVRLQ